MNNIPLIAYIKGLLAAIPLTGEESSIAPFIFLGVSVVLVIAFIIISIIKKKK